MRRWRLDVDSPLALQLAADARVSSINPEDDQVWALVLGRGDEPALAFQTRYGGRTGLASLVPMWQVDGRVIYEADAYASPPVVAAFAPGYACATAKLTAALSIKAEYLVVESQAVLGRYTIANRTTEAVSVRLDVFGHVVSGGKEQQLSILTLRDGGHALYLGRIHNIDPVMLVHSGDAGPDASPKVGITVDVLPSGKTVIEWAHAGLPNMLNSLQRARHWLENGWEAPIKRMLEAAEAIPQVETGNADWDAVIAFSFMHAVQALVNNQLMAARGISHGYSERARWSVHPVHIADQIVPALGTIDRALAESYLVQLAQNPVVDGELSPPLLAKLTSQHVSTHYGDDASPFLRQIYPHLLAWVQRWLDEHDADRDGVPEWDSLKQAGYPFHPSFSGQSGADIRTAELPDLISMIVTEHTRLNSMAELIGVDQPNSEVQRETLIDALDTMWYEDTYVARDRDSHTVNTGLTIIEEGRGDVEHLPALALSSPARLLVSIVGAGNLRPNLSLTIDGLDADGNEIQDVATRDDVTWRYNRGTYTTQTVFAQVDRVRAEGLSRVMSLTVSTPDTAAKHLSGLTPRIHTDRDRIGAMLGALAAFRQANGLTLYPLTPEDRNNGGGVWPHWQGLIAEAIAEQTQQTNPQDRAIAAEVLQTLLSAQATVLRETGFFPQYYHPTQPKGIGEGHSLSGIVPLSALMHLLGFYVLSPSVVVVQTSRHTWDDAVKVTQFGVVVTREQEQIVIVFPSGHEVSTKIEDGMQRIVDPTAAENGPKAVIRAAPAPPPPPAEEPPKPATPVYIEVEFDDNP